MIDREADLMLTRQAELLALSRSGLYYEPKPMSAKDLELMRCIDRLHTDWPFGVDRLGWIDFDWRSSGIFPLVVDRRQVVEA